MKASTFSKEEAMARYVSVALSVVKSRGEQRKPASRPSRCVAGVVVAFSRTVVHDRWRLRTRACYKQKCCLLVLVFVWSPRACCGRLVRLKWAKETSCIHATRTREVVRDSKAVQVVPLDTLRTDMSSVGCGW